MPLYEYECSSCHHRFEKIESFDAEEEKPCPKCGSVAKRVLAPSAIQFKGSGWYVTDYARKNSAPPPAPAGADKPAEKSGSETKKEGSNS